MQKKVNQVNDKELLLKAIENYSLLPPTGRTLLITLIKLAIDDVVIINIKELSKISKISRPAVYSNLQILQDNGIIELQRNPGSRLSTFILKPQKFNYIIKHYTVKENILHN